MFGGISRDRPGSPCCSSAVARPSTTPHRLSTLRVAAVTEPEPVPIPYGTGSLRLPSDPPGSHTDHTWRVHR
jgi:hypothetical protein